MRVNLEQLIEARFVKIAHRRFAVRSDPFRMLPSQIVVNLLLKLGQRVSRMVDYNVFGRNPRRDKHKCWTDETYVSFN